LWGQSRGCQELDALNALWGKLSLHLVAWLNSHFHFKSVFSALNTLNTITFTPC